MSAIFERIRQLRNASLLAVPIGLMVVGGLMVSGGRAEAAPVLQATETPTATLAAPTMNLFDVPTLPSMPEGGGCPVGTPIGYGTVTPSGSWDMICSQCVQDDGVWPTAGPSSTPGPSPTPTVTASGPTVTPEGDWWSYSPASELGSADHNGGELLVATGTIHSEDVCGAPNAIAAVRGTMFIQPYNQWAGGSFGFNSGSAYWWAPQSAADRTMDGWVRAGFYYNLGDFPGLEALIDAWPVQGVDGWDQLWTPQGEKGTDTVSYAVKVVYAVISWSIPEVICYKSGYGGGWEEATPTPSPTATPDPSYCATVEDGSDSAVDFGWTGFIQYDAVCLNVGPYDGVSFLGFSLPPVPWILHLCLAPMSLGWFTVFTVGVPVDGLLYLMAAIFILRKLT